MCFSEPWPGYEEHLEDCVTHDLVTGPVLSTKNPDNFREPDLSANTQSPFIWPDQPLGSTYHPQVTAPENQPECLLSRDLESRRKDNINTETSNERCQLLRTCKCHVLTQVHLNLLRAYCKVIFQVFYKKIGEILLEPELLTS